MPTIYESADTRIVWNSGSQTGTTIVGCDYCSSTSATHTQIWRIWTSAATTTTAVSVFDPDFTAGTWLEWNRELQRSMETIGTAITVGARRLDRTFRAQMSAEERARHEEYECATERKYQEERAARIVAEEKAEILLQRLLNPEQRESLEKNRHFYLHSAGKRYRIDRGQTGNVKLVDEKDQVIQSYCIHPNGVPDADAMAAQKLMLEADPETFERVANITFRNGQTRRGTPLQAVG